MTYCGVCAVRIGSPRDNGGSFKANDFGGWEPSGQVTDTCSSCAAVLRAAVANAARMILLSNGVRLRVEARRAELGEVVERYVKVGS